MSDDVVHVEPEPAPIVPAPMPSPPPPVPPLPEKINEKLVELAEHLKAWVRQELFLAGTGHSDAERHEKNP